MNGKHPIDDLFARNLRDAEVQPPPAVWAGIASDRDRVRLARQRAWRNRGIAAALLLLVGTATVHLLSGPGDPQENGQVSERQASPAPQGSSVDPAGNRASTSSAAPGGLEQTDKVDGVAGTGTDVGQQMEGSVPTSSERDEDPGDGERGDPGPASTAVSGAVVKGGKNSANTNGGENSGDLRTSNIAELGAVLAASGSVKTSPSSSTDVPPRSGSTLTGSRSSQDVHLTSLSILPSPPIQTAVVDGPGPMMTGDSLTPYVLASHNWWIAVQGELSMLNGEWKGNGAEVEGLNASETWQNGSGVGIAAGCQWLSGWSVGVGLGVTRQRSRFLHHKETPGTTAMMVDTTWTITPMGTESNYTWDIVETLVEEPGAEQDYNATNEYTRLRITPEVAYRAVECGRLSIHARLAPIVQFDMGRKGSTLIASTSVDTLETPSDLNVVPLNSARVDERFPVGLALSGGFDIRYRFADRFSIGLLPTFTYWLPTGDGHVPYLSMNEFGGALRLRYDFRHNERRGR